MYDFTIGEVVSISNLKIMIYEGTEDKPYEKYGATPSTEFPSIPLVCTGVQKIKANNETLHTLDLSTTELCAIKENGNIVAEDRIIYHNAKWQFDKIIKKLALNGTEDWVQTTAYEGFYRYSLEVNDNDLVYSSSVTVHGVNSHFNQRINQGHGGYEYLYVQGTPRGGTIYIQIKNIDTVEKLKTFLAEQYSNNIPVTIYFVSKNHLYIDCTAEQSEVLEKLYNNFELQKGVNNVIVESENGVGVNMELTLSLIHI